MNPLTNNLHSFFIIYHFIQIYRILRLLIFKIIIYRLFKIFGFNLNGKFLRANFIEGMLHTKIYKDIDKNINKNRLAFNEAENIINILNSKDFYR